MVRLVLPLLSLLFFFSSAVADDFPLLSALKYQSSIVTIHVLRTETSANPTAQAALDPKTGRILIARQAISASLVKKGTGIIINPEGLVITNFHTINGAQKLSVRLHDGTSVPVKILNFNQEDDLAFLKIEAPYGLTPIPFADSNTVGLRDYIYHIGNSEVLENTISGGLVTGIGTSNLLPPDAPKEVELIQTNINVYKGDSGGPILNKDGELIGMIVAKNTTTDRVSFAIPSNKIKKLYLDFLK